MDLEPRSFFMILLKKTQDESTGPNECKSLLSSLNNTIIEEQQNSSLLDSYVLQMFDKCHGILNFVTFTIGKKDYRGSTIKILEILYTFLNTFHKKLEKHVTTVNEICLKIIKCSASSADEKLKALEVLTLGFEKIDKCLEYEEHYTDVYKSLKHSFQFKKCDKVQSKLLIALGTFAQKFQYILSDPEVLKTQFISQLDIEMTQKHISYGIINGVYTGFARLCESFPFDPNSEQDQITIKKLYKYIEKLAIPVGRIKIGNRAALTFLTKNIYSFSNLLLVDYIKWHNLLLQWLTYSPEDQKVGTITIEAYYHGLSKVLISTEDCEEIAMYFLNYFKKVLNDEFASNYEKRSSLRGLCAFSGVYYNHLKPKEVTDLFIMILQIFEQTYIIKDILDDSSLEYLPDYIQTVAQIIRFKKISSSESFCLQRGVINMMKTFPRLPYSYHSYVIDALVSTIHCLKMNDVNLCNNFMDNTIYQGVVWACSHQHISETELAESDKEKIITVKNSLPLWKGLLRIKPMSKYDLYEIFHQDREYILVTLVDKLVKTLLILINKLNVSIIQADTQLTDIQTAYKVAEMNDFAIFLNVVDFYQEILIEIDPTILRKCIAKIVNHSIMKCVKFPFISGFYKLLSLSLKICNNLNYFQNDKQDVVTCLESLSKFLEILLVKLNQFKDDLLISCLQVLLEYPVVLITAVLHSCTAVFITIFNLGRNYIPLVVSALDTLERWQNVIPSEDFDPFLVQVLPVLDTYLQSRSPNGSSSLYLQNRRKTVQTLKKRRMVLEIEPELLQIQRRILNFIGRQSSFLCLAFVSIDRNIQLAVWGEKERLKITLPFEDIKLEFYLDRFFPRIVHLALYCSDRKTRIISCELLQAVVMVFLGTTKKMNSSGQSDLDEILRCLAMPLMKLGCDMDQLVQDIFQPLFLQLIHWYTHVSQVGTEHSAIIVETVLDGITHPTDSSLRDFSGKCINEFVKWTIKQSDDIRLERNPLHFKILLNKMRFFSTHPDPNKKMGAALIFNNVYKEIREQPILLSMFWIEYLHIFIKSLDLIGNNSEEENAIAQIHQALDHIQRGFVDKSSLFNETDKYRRIPSSFDGGTLKDVSLWILYRTGSESDSCREKCMELFINIAVKVKNVITLRKFIVENMRDVNWIRKTYQKFETPSNSDYSVLMKWLRQLLCLLDGLNFVIMNKLSVDKFVLDSTWIQGITFFIKLVVSASIEEAINSVKVVNSSFSSFQKSEYTKLKSKIIIKIFKFLNQESVDVKVFYINELWSMIINCIFNPEKIGFEDNLVMHSEVMKFLKNIPEKQSSEINHMITSYIEDRTFTRLDLRSNVKLKERNFVIGLLLLQSWHLKNLNIEQFSVNLVVDFMKSIAAKTESKVIYAEELQDTTLRHCLSILDFGLSYIQEFQIFEQFLYEKYEVQCLDNTKPINFGLYVLSTFEISVISKILENFEFFLLKIKTSDEDMPRTIEILTYVLNVMLNDKKYRHFYEYIGKNLMHRWDIFQNYFKQEAHVELGMDFIKLILPLIKLYKLESNGIKLWMIALLSPWLSSEHFTEEDLDLKFDVFFILSEILEEELHDSENEELESGLRYLEMKYFIESSPLPRERVLSYIGKFLAVLPIVKSSNFVVFLLKIYILNHHCGVTKTPLSGITNLLKSFMWKAPDIVQERTLLKSFQLCFNSQFSATQKYNLTTTIIPLFQWCKLEIFERFYVDTVKDMIAILEEPTIEENICKKIVAFMLFEILFYRLKITSKAGTVSPITQALIPSNPQNKNFIRILLKFLSNTLKERIESRSNASELLRLYKCHSYNTMVSIVSNSLKDQNFYLKLFERLENGEDILWKGLIDTTIIYRFTEDFESIPQRRKVLVNIRTTLKDQRKNYDRFTETAVEYFETQRVYNSSLSEDFTKFDFTETIVRSQLNDGTIWNRREENEGLSEIELDSVDVNGHECMATICGLIEHMIQSGSTILPDDHEDDYVLPSWIEVIRKLLLDPITSTNVKIFWIKVIDNTIHIFQRFAKHFLEPLLKFVVDKCAGDHINYFVVDVVSTLASWSKFVLPSNEIESKLVSQLLKFLVVNINIERQDIFKYHLELIKLIIEAWKCSITVPFNEILYKFNAEITSKKIMVGVHLLSVFLVNNLVPWNGSTNFPKFCLKLFDIVGKNMLQSMYRPGAETIGLMLNFSKKELNFPKILNNVQVMINKISQFEKYGHVLEAITMHYPELANEFHLKRMLSVINSSAPDLQVIFLKVILRRCDVVGTLAAFKIENWSKYLEHSKFEIQILTLELVNNTLEDLMDSEHFVDIIKSVCNNCANINIICRSLMCDIAISICLKHNEMSAEFSLCRDILLQSLIDRNEEIRDKVLDFWEKNSNLPDSAVSRFSHILNNLYKSSTENEFLGYFTYLMLSSIKNCNEYIEKIFEYPLEDCDFEDLILNANCRRYHMSLVPMFAETLRSFNEDVNTSKSDFNQLRQTQTNLTFAPTQSLQNERRSQFTSTQSTLFIKSDDLFNDNEKNFINPNDVIISQKYRVPKKRFLSDKSKISKQIAQYEVKKSVHFVDKRRDSAKDLENKVVILRSYRKGDLPDVQIPLSDIIAPLQSLALVDPDISKTLFFTLFSSLVRKTEGDVDFISTIYGGIKNIFNASTQYNTNLFRSLFDMILMYKRVMFFDPNDIANMCLSSGLITVGALLLEEYLICQDYSQQSSSSNIKRKRGVPEDGESTFWVKLAELYKEIDEWDRVKSIFLEKLDCKESVRQALLSESKKQWRKAVEHYRSLLQEDDTLTKKDFYYEAYFKCLAHMGQWEDVADTIEKVAACENEDVWKSLWNNDWNRRKLLPWYIDSKLKEALFTQCAPDVFFTNLNETFNSSLHSDNLQKRFSEELSMLWMFQNEFEYAKQQLRIYIDNFLEDWQLLDSVYINLRYNKLLRLRNVVDIYQFIDVFDLNVDYDFDKILTYWRNTSKENLPSILYNETRTLYRSEFLGRLVKKMKEFDQEDFQSILIDLAKLKFSVDSDLIDTAIDQNNFYMGRKYIRKYEAQTILKIKLSVSKLLSVRALTQINDPKAKLDSLLSGLDTLSPCLIPNNDLNLNLKAHLQFFNNFKEICQVLQENQNLFSEKYPKILEFTEEFKIHSINCLACFGAQKLRCFIEKYENDLNDAMGPDLSKKQKDYEQLAKAYTQLAYFAKSQPRSYYKNFISSVLRAMKLSSQNARQLFPCILIEDLNDEEQDIFLRESEEIPIWMFCEWIPQLLVNIYSPKISIVSGLIIKITKTYPHAIMYAYRLSKKTFEFQNAESVNRNANDLIEHLDRLLLSDERTNKFLKALSAVCIPSIALSYYVAKVLKACVRRSLKLIDEAVDQIKLEIFNELPDSKDVTRMKGNMYKKIGKYKLNIMAASHSDTLFNSYKLIYAELEADKKDEQDSKLLKDYCPWLANFSADKLNLDLEIPGQYDGKKMPLVQYHARISGFHPNVSIMKSLRKPIKLTILGNDTKEYPFLIKFGEDIRQDQRIQQLFTLMNGLLSHQEGLAIETYQVIPLTANLGIIEWVNETASLQEFMEKSLTENSLKKYKKIADTYHNFIFGRGTKTITDGYGNFALNMSRDKTIAKYRSLVNETPWDILRQSFWKLSSNTESFFSLRTNFIKSYAVLCGSHWLLGIGDRHLCNSLICLRNGKVLGIDFGHAFGTATQILSVPELVPFRLTPHIIGLMEPIGERGLFREIMIRTLKNLRDKKGSLLATMNVFIQEPSLDWLEHAAKFEDNNSEQNEKKEWYPFQKIGQAERKLNGSNSTTIMVEELTLDQKKNKSYIEAYVRLVRGSPEHDLRARKDPENLSPYDQVDCLIDHATDYNLLGRMYEGWAPWV